MIRIQKLKPRREEENEKRILSLRINQALAFHIFGKDMGMGKPVAGKPLPHMDGESDCADELSIAYEELTFQNEERLKRANELAIANKNLAFESGEKKKRAAELAIANIELAFEQTEKEKRAAELLIANDVLAFEQTEKEKRATELAITNIELRTAEDDIRKLNESLELKVIQRTAELNAANNELESFSYSVSHDLSSPLRIVRGYTQMLQQEYAAGMVPDAQDMISSILTNTKKMEMLISDLLAFSSISRAEMILARVPMQDQVQDICAGIHGQREAGQPEIKFDLGSLPDIQGDISSIRQVWVNLISNAVKYSSHTLAPHIRIGAEAIDGEIVYHVIDNGAGFDMKYADKLFEVFQRLHSTEEFAGTGIGLAIVHRIIQKHGGRIWAESEIGNGASFYFSLSA